MRRPTLSLASLAPLSLTLLLAACGSSSASASPDTDAATDAASEAGADAATDTAIEAGADAAPDAPITMPPFSEKLSEMGLYADFAGKALSPAVIEYAPIYPLWSDAAQKRRWLWLPAGATIDTSDMDHWVFPIGTRVFKEFVRDGKRLETRMIERTADGDYRFGSYVWNDAETEALWTTTGVTGARGTDHDVPAVGVCNQCHNSEPGHVLGFSAVQLSGTTGVTLDTARAKGWLSAPPPAGTRYAAPGDATTSKALGVLHANCGTCHNDQSIAYSQTDQVLRLYVGETTPQSTRIWKTSVGQKTQSWLTLPLRIAAGDASSSAIWVRMSHRAPDPGPMPPVGTKIVDPDGLAAVKAWIDALPK
jgi:hypothetical protein